MPGPDLVFCASRCGIIQQWLWHLSVGLNINNPEQGVVCKIRKGQWSDLTRSLVHVRIVSWFYFMLQLAGTKVWVSTTLGGCPDQAFNINHLCFFFLVINHALFATATVFQHAEQEVGISACLQPCGMLLGDGKCGLQPQNLMGKCTENHLPATNILATNVL